METPTVRLQRLLMEIIPLPTRRRTPRGRGLPLRTEVLPHRGLIQPVHYTVAQKIRDVGGGDLRRQNPRVDEVSDALGGFLVEQLRGPPHLPFRPLGAADGEHSVLRAPRLLPFGPRSEGVDGTEPVFVEEGFDAADQGLGAQLSEMCRNVPDVHQRFVAVGAETVFAGVWFGGVGYGGGDGLRGSGDVVLECVAFFVDGASAASAEFDEE